MGEDQTVEQRGVSTKLISLVIPVFNEADNIVPLLSALKSSVESDHETMLVYDFDEDTTLPPARSFASEYPELRLVHNTLGPGVLNALKAGFAASNGDVVIVTMADLSDDVSQIDTLGELTRGGAAVVAGSRYMQGGAQIGGPALKSLLSRVAGLSLRWLTRIGTHDATNNYKAYSREFVDEVAIESGSGFELGVELTTKAHLMGFEVTEIPTTWRDRTEGESRFQVMKWMPSYLRWYLLCIGGTWTGKARRSRKKRRGSSRVPRPRSGDVSKE